MQPEKVLSLPLDLRLNQDYAYRLDGVDTVGGRPAFVVRFDPVDATHALYRGTVWIDRATFVRLKVQAVETKLSGPVVSNDETQVFEPSGDIDGRPVWLLESPDQQADLPDRRPQRADRARSPPVGLRAERARLRPRAERRAREQPDHVPRHRRGRPLPRQAGRDARRQQPDDDVGQGVRPGGRFRSVLRLSRCRSAGINILDFNFLNRNLQLALLYGGVIAFGNIQHANLWGGKFDASVDFFGLALKANDDVFDAQGKRAGERVDRIPVAAGLNLGYQVTPFQKISGSLRVQDTTPTSGMPRRRRTS